MKTNYQDWVEHLTALRGEVALVIQDAEKQKMNTVELGTLEQFRRGLNVSHDALLDLIGIEELKQEGR
jgi:hypothetical protein